MKHEGKKSQTQVQLECITSATQTTQLRHEWKITILTTNRVKTYFRNPLLDWHKRKMKWKITRRETVSCYELPFGNASFPSQRAFEKCITKTKFCNNKTYIKKLYILTVRSLARSRIVKHSNAISFPARTI